MDTTQPSRTASGAIKPVPPSRADRVAYLGLLSVLIFSVFTAWSPDRWAASGTQAGVFLLAMVAAVRCVFGAVWRRSWLLLPFLAAALWGLLQLSTNHSVYRFATWSAELDWLTLLLAFWAALQLFGNSGLLKSFRLFSIYFGAFLALWAILQLFSADGKILWFYSPPAGGKPMGPFLNYDHYSAFIELLFAVALWEALTDRRRAILYGCLAAIMYASVIAGASRAGSVLINLELGAVLIPTITRRARRDQGGGGRVALAVGLLVLIFSLVVGWDVLLQRFQDKDPFSGRWEDWQAGLQMVHDRPLMGFGLGTWTTAYPGYAIYDPAVVVNAAHSDWLQWAGEGGLPFALLLVLVAVRSLQLAVRSPWGLGIFFVFLHCVVDFPFQKVPISLWLVVLLATLDTDRSVARSKP